MHARLYLAACASVALLSACACTNNANDNADRTKATPETTAAAKGAGSADDQPRPIALTGCLQKGDGRDYILTQINEPPKGEPVAEQDAKEAEHSYRLNAKTANDDQWPSMVGREVRVSGTLAKRGDVAQKVGTSGSTDTTPKLHESDLAQVDVSDIQQVSAACGGRAEKSAARKGAKNGAKAHRK